MKAVYKILTLTLGVFLLGISSCYKDTETCKDMDFNNPYEVRFDISVLVEYEDGSIYSGKVSNTIYKVYCDATINGRWVQEGVTSSSNGYWHPSINRGYSFTNPDDVVEVEWKVDKKVIMLDTFKESDVRGKTQISKTYTYVIKK